MKIIYSLAILLALASWASLGLTFTNLLSGYFEDRTCLTDCVRNYYFTATGLGFISALLAFVGLFRSGFTSGSFLLLVFCALPFFVIAGIFAIGTLGA